MFYKIRKIIVVFPLLVICVICGIMIYDVNKRIPAPKKYIYTKDNPCNIDSVKFTPQKATIYTYDELKEKYPDYEPMLLQNMPKEVRYVVYEIEVSNLSMDVKSFYPVYFEAADCKTGWSNGVEPRFPSNIRTVLEPLETINLELISLNVKGDFSDDLILAMSYYPNHRIMKFKE